jgi:ABC-type polysaccharide/polyol phosphate export permease
MSDARLADAAADPRRMFSMRWLTSGVEFLKLLARQRDTIRRLVARDIRSRYMGSILGLFWSVIHPLIQVALYYFVFSLVLRMRVGAEYGGTHFAFWLVAGLLPWTLFAEMIGRAPAAVLEQADVVKKMVCPSEIFSVVHVAAAAVSHLIGLSIILAFLAMAGYPVTWKALLVLPYLMDVLLIGLGISWALASLNVFLRDIGQVVGVVIQIWFFLTPIFYAVSLVPASLQPLYGLNPMVYVIEGYRAALLSGGTSHPIDTLYLLIAGTVLCVLGGLIFRRLKPAFADVL